MDTFSQVIGKTIKEMWRDFDDAEIIYIIFEDGTKYTLDVWHSGPELGCITFTRDKEEK